MPELPEVETIRRGLVGKMETRRLVKVTLRRPDLRFPFPKGFAASLTGRQIVGVGRRAKYMLWHLEDGNCVVVHLGMSGRITIQESDNGRYPEPGKHDHALFLLDNGARIVFCDPRRFGFIDLIPPNTAIEDYKSFAKLGPEPLSNSFDSRSFAEILSKKASPIKSVLLDQRVVAGLGNIYACEALYRSKISPIRKANTISADKYEPLVRNIKAVLKEAIDAGGSTLKDYVQSDGELGYFQHAFQVYNKEGAACEKCGDEISRIVQSGRSSFYCPSCQK